MFRPVAPLKRISKKVHHNYSLPFLKNVGEPKDTSSRDTLANDEKVLSEDSSAMRHRFRGVAQRIRYIKVRKSRKNFEASGTPE